MKLRESPSVHMGVEVSQGSGFPVRLTREEFTRDLRPLSSLPGLWAARQQILLPEGIKLRWRNLGEFCWSARVPMLDICVRHDRNASRLNAEHGSDFYRINDLAKTVKAW